MYLKKMTLAMALLGTLAACGGGDLETTSISVGPMMYGKRAVVTVEGPNVGRGVTLVAPLCTDIAKVGGATESRQDFTCTPNTVGEIAFVAVGGGVILHSYVSQVPPPQVTVKTRLGEVVMELDPKAAPLSVKNFLKYVSDGFYNNLIFHRVIRGFVIQAGGYNASLEAAVVRDPIKLEAGNGLSNLRGTVAMARTFEADSATSQFYINTVDNTSLDTLNGGYAVFGRVISGLSTVDAISAEPTVATEVLANVPITPVVMLSMVQTQ